MTCEKCLSPNISADHASSHVHKSLSESAQFEVALEMLIESLMEEHKISKKNALSLALEQVRDSMRKRGHEDFSFLLSDWTDMAGEEEEDE